MNAFATACRNIGAFMLATREFSAFANKIKSAAQASVVKPALTEREGLAMLDELASSYGRHQGWERDAERAKREKQSQAAQGSAVAGRAPQWLGHDMSLALLHMGALKMSSLMIILGKPQDALSFLSLHQERHAEKSNPKGLSQALAELLPLAQCVARVRSLVSAPGYDAARQGPEMQGLAEELFESAERMAKKREERQAAAKPGSARARRASAPDTGVASCLAEAALAYWAAGQPDGERRAQALLQKSYEIGGQAQKNTELGLAYPNSHQACVPKGWADFIQANMGPSPSASMTP